MPSRSVIVTVVVLWLAVMAWLVHRDIWWRLAPEEPPPFTVDFMDYTQSQPLPTRWRVTRWKEDAPVLTGILTTTILHHRRTDLIDLVARFEPRFGPGGALPPVQHDRFESRYRIDIHGRLL